MLLLVLDTELPNLNRNQYVETRYQLVRKACVVVRSVID